MKKTIRLTESDLVRIVRLVINEADTKVQGCVKGDCKNGYGELSVKNSNYQGTWGNVDGFYYKGQFKNGKKEGYGTVKLNNGGTFKGHFKNNFVDGYGTFTNKHGRLFQGQWLGRDPSPIFSNLGTTSQPENKQYVGQYLANLGDIKKQSNIDTTKCWYDDPIKDPDDWVVSKTDKNYEYFLPKGNNKCYWTRNVKTGKIFNLTDMAKTNPKIQKSIDILAKDYGFSTYDYSDSNNPRVRD